MWAEMVVLVRQGFEKCAVEAGVGLVRIIVIRI